MKNRILIIIISIFIFSSCSVLKDKTTEDKSTKDVVTEQTKTTKKGGKTILDVPKLNYILKDTTIYSVNKETKTILSTRYDSKGNQRIECLESDIDEIKTLIKESTKNDVETRDKTKSEFNPQQILYAIAGLGLVIVLVMVVFMYMMMKIQKATPELISNIIKSNIT